MACALGKQVIHAGNRAVLCDNDNLHACGIAVCEVDSLQALAGDGHTGHTHVRLAAVDGRDDGVKLHVLDFEFHIQLLRDCRRNLRVDTDNLSALVVLIRRESRVGRHDERALGV